MVSLRFALIAAAFLVSLFAIYQFMPWTPITSWPSLSDTTRPITNPAADGLASSHSPDESKSFDNSIQVIDSTSSRPPEVQNYFSQVFSVGTPVDYSFPHLAQQCAQNVWPDQDDVPYLKCSGMGAGLTSIISQVKVCLKMAVDIGANLVLPAMPLRDSTDLNDYHFSEVDGYLNFDEWFDGPHFVSNFQKACPRIKIIHPHQLKYQSDSITKMSPEVPVRRNLTVEIGKAKGYHFPDSIFWVGRPFKTFFNEQYANASAELLASQSGDSSISPQSSSGITVVGVHSAFLLYRITDDPTRQDLNLWNDLSLLIRFTETERVVIDRVLKHMDRPFYGVHFRVEKDNIWSPLEKQLATDLDALDAAWAKFGSSDPSAQKPLVYLACGDSEAVEKFVDAGKERGWEVTHKYKLAEHDPDTKTMIEELAFDFQGAVDYGVMVKADFYIGITGSAFSATVSNARDSTGRYRGSSFEVYDDGGARTHVVSDIDAQAYPCCL